MDERLKSIVDNFDSMKIGADDSFPFHCTMCGKCCINREDILLTPRDIYNMSKELGISPKELFEKYCETYIGGDSRIPIVRLYPRGSIRRCPLLKNRKCSVHKAKPAVCAMFPIGRCMMFGADGALAGKIKEEQIQFIFTNPGCGDVSETHTVREWLDAFDIPIVDEFFIRWHQTVMELGQIFRKEEKESSEQVMRMAWFATFAGLYLNYDTKQEFMPQFEENAQEILTLMCRASSGEGGEQDA